MPKVRRKVLLARALANIAGTEDVNGTVGLLSVLAGSRGHKE